MSLIEIVTDEASKAQLSKVLDKHIVKDNKVIYIKEENLENIKNIKLETSVINSKILSANLIKKITDNSKYLIVNLDYNSEIRKIAEGKKIITYGYNSKSDLTVSSRKEEQTFLSLQRNIISVFSKKIYMQEIKANISYNINVYDVMIIIALTILYAK